MSTHVSPHGVLTVVVPVVHVPRGLGYGSKNEHPSTTRSRALKEAREVWGPKVVIHYAVQDSYGDGHKRMFRALMVG